MDEPTAALANLAKCWLEVRVREAKLIPMTVPICFVEVPSDFQGQVFETDNGVYLPRAYLLWSMMPMRLYVGNKDWYGCVGVQEVK